MTVPTPKMSLEQRVQRLEDIEEIKRLRALYCFYNDGGWPEHGPSHAGPCADLYTEDAEWDGRPFMPLMEGRAALQKGIDEAARMSFVMHYVMNPIIDVEGDEAKGQWHMFACTKLPDHTSHWQLGYYFEEYRRTPEGWRIRKTRFVTARVFPELTGWNAAAPFDEIAATRMPELAEKARSALTVHAGEPA